MTQHSWLKRKLHLFFMILFKRFNLYKNSFARKLYWNTRAKDIDAEWGRSDKDFSLVGDIITSLKADRILDIGCGSGRLFPLYRKLGVGEVVGQEISKKALDLASSRYDYKNIRVVFSPIESLDFPESYFDLVVSNRVLQHIPPEEIDSAAKTVCRLAKYAYINEIPHTEEACVNLLYAFPHDYVRLFAMNGFEVERKGVSPGEPWILFKKVKPAEP